jgi:hypothetical protein
MDVEVRQWSDHCFAAYVFDGDPLGRFVGTDTTRERAHRLGRSLIGESASRCGVSGSGRVSGVSEQACVGESGDAQRERLQRSTAGLDPNPDLTRK